MLGVVALLLAWWASHARQSTWKEITKAPLKTDWSNQIWRYRGGDLSKWARYVVAQSENKSDQKKDS